MNNIAGIINMKNILILIIFLLISIICTFIVSCDDFFHPTIEIFNEIKTPVNTEQDNTQNNKKNTDINQQQL